jgi:hypothetical protein
MTNNDYFHALLAVSLRLPMYLVDQGAGRIDDPEVSSLRMLHYLRGYTMGAEDDPGAHRYIVEIFNENDTASLQILHNAAIVDDLVEHKYRFSVQLKGPFDGFNSADYPGTKASGLGEYYFHKSTGSSDGDIQVP